MANWLCHERGGGGDFSDKNGGVFLKMGVNTNINSLFIKLSLRVCRVCVCFAHLY